MTRFAIRLTCTALTIATLTLVAAPKARAEDDPRIKAIINTLRELTDANEDIKSRLKRVESSQSAYRPAPVTVRTNIIRLVNESVNTATIVLNSQGYRLAPGASVTLRAGTGTYRYRLASDTWSQSITLDEYEAVTIRIGDAGDDE